MERLIVRILALPLLACALVAAVVSVFLWMLFEIFDKLAKYLFHVGVIVGTTALCACLFYTHQARIATFFIERLGQTDGNYLAGLVPYYVVCVAIAVVIWAIVRDYNQNETDL